MTNQVAVNFDVIRTIAHGSISGSYAAVGTPLGFPVRLICFTNNTDGDMFISVDGANNCLFIAAGSFKLFDIGTNRVHAAPIWSIASGTQFYIMQSSAPTKGNFYIECLY